MARKRIEPQGFVTEPPKRVVTVAELAALYALTAVEVERRARETALRFGVDPNLSPKERCLAVARKVRLSESFRRAGVLEREAGADFEEDACR